MCCLLCYTERKTFSIIIDLKNNWIHPHTFYLKIGIISRGNFSYSNKVFVLQKKIIRIVVNTRTTDSCKELFKDIKILVMYSQYILYTVVRWQTCVLCSPIVSAVLFLLLLLLILLLLITYLLTHSLTTTHSLTPHSLTAVELAHGGSSRDTSTDKTNNNKFT
jgi:hypothetical protein